MWYWDRKHGINVMFIEKTKVKFVRKVEHYKTDIQSKVSKFLREKFKNK